MWTQPSSADVVRVTHHPILMKISNSTGSFSSSNLRGFNHKARGYSRTQAPAIRPTVCPDDCATYDEKMLPLPWSSRRGYGWRGNIRCLIVLDRQSDGRYGDQSPCYRDKLLISTLHPLLIFVTAYCIHRWDGQHRLSMTSKTCFSEDARQKKALPWLSSLMPIQVCGFPTFPSPVESDTGPIGYPIHLQLNRIMGSLPARRAMRTSLSSFVLRYQYAKLSKQSAIQSWNLWLDHSFP